MWKSTLVTSTSAKVGFALWLSAFLATWHLVSYRWLRSARDVNRGVQS